MSVLIWSLTCALLLTGLVGCVMPLLPGTTLILLGVLLHKWLLPTTLSWIAVGWIASFWLLSVIADLLGTLVGTRLLGGSKWGMAGATGGALAGLFVSLPALVIGSITGAVAAEKLLGKRTNEEAMRAGAGALIGMVLGTASRVACAVAMIGLFVLAVW
ncbi:MAG: DUF456 domain-containing protein [Opitutaceae bacterium]|nr:DUF456 domain-containing protein [Opitutaceae bacterium]